MGRTGILLKDILHAVHLAGLEPFISGLKEGLQTEVQPAGENFPTNVVKKILLARSFVIKPKMLLIDEFFHNVNTAEKQVLLQTLFAGDYALIIVSTLPEIMKRCDKIIVLKEGGLFDMGTYSELDSRKSLPVAY
jgi:ATP-binding cassette subfamily B protein